MKEHAIPQDITGYKFHIVGNMTLKQFAEVALGVVMAFFIYKTNLYFPIKWALIASSAALGFALAFLPIEERPLDHWFTIFFSILYKPTKFYWKREPKIPEAFTFVSHTTAKTQISTVDLTPQRRSRITQYLQSVKTTKGEDSEDVYYRQRSSQLLDIFNDHSLKINYDRFEKIKKKPNLKVKVRSLIGTEEENNQPVIEASQTNTEISYDLSNTQEVVLEQQQKEYSPLSKKVISTNAVATEISIPETENIQVENVYQQQQIATEEIVTQTQGTAQQMVNVEPETIKNNVAVNKNAVVRNKDLPFPTRPTKPNKLVGMTLTKNNDLINGATLTLKDKNGKSITAITSNALGQFFITSQLPNGTYTINIKKDGFSFAPVTINLVGETIDPLEIRSNE